MIADDARDGGGHVDSPRSVALVAGAYVKQHAQVPTQHNTIDHLRTIEEVLGIPPMNLNAAGKQKAAQANEDRHELS